MRERLRRGAALMDRELVDAGQVGTAVAVLSFAALIAAAALGAMARSQRSKALTRGALLAGAAVLLWPLWLVYNIIEDRFGLDSVAALLINLALFVAVGAGGGLMLRRFWPVESVDHGDTETRRD